MNEQLTQIQKKIQETETALVHLSRKYDEVYVAHVVERNLLAAPLTSNQICILTGLAEGSVRNLFGKAEFRKLLTDDRRGQRTMSYGDVVTHIMTRQRGQGRKVDETRRTAILALIDTGMTLQQISETVKVSIKTVERIKAEREMAQHAEKIRIPRNLRGDAGMNPLIMMQSLGMLALAGSIAGRAGVEVEVQKSSETEVVLDEPDLTYIDPPARYHEPYSGYSSARQERRAHNRYKDYKAEAKKKAVAARRRMGGGRP